MRNLLPDLGLERDAFGIALHNFMTGQRWRVGGMTNDNMR
jgi:hypothetical protein